jgi:hypothetical protein
LTAGTAGSTTRSTCPARPSPELRKLAELARTPWLGLVVSVLSQTMFADGYKASDSRDDSAAWLIWRANGFDSRQTALHRAALAYGYAFATALPGEDDFGNPIPVLRGYSPLEFQALYNDPANDDLPAAAIRVIRNQPGSRWHLRVYDEESVYYLDCAEGGSGVNYLSQDDHGAGFTPVVRYANQLDLEGRTPGEVEPFIPIAARINKTDYDRLLTQHFTGWQIRYASGLAKPENDQERAAMKLHLRQDDMLIAEDADTKFGVLPAGQIDGFIAAKKDEVYSLAAASQTPTHALTGDLINIGPDALASARAQLDQKANERRVAFGDSHARLLRIASYFAGDPGSTVDVSSRITWQDTSIRSMSQAVDALGKAAQMLQVPVRALWPLIPGVTKDDVNDWIAAADKADPISALSAKLTAGLDEAA